ncbi:MAG: hypothetical protein OJF50_003063 [Nitrospira sp.]|jgi:hypothetical protein|nr:hypothetical protein [Nitrospira sp.]
MGNRGAPGEGGGCHLAHLEDELGGREVVEELYALQLLPLVARA